MEKTMKNLGKFFVMACLVAFTAACGKDDDQGTTVEPGIEQPVGTEELSGNISSDRTLKANTRYVLKGFVYVTNNATLTIEPGTIIKGDKDTDGSLIVERGSKIMAEGTREKPIVFTSNMPKGQRKVGDWGGVIILGNAPVNLPGQPKIEGGVDRPYGGSNAADNSGILKYVRIEYSGIPFQPGNEINGLTLGGVGSGTVIDYVQVSYNGDDSFEMFGGTVNAKHLIAYKNVDDMFDSDNGYSGKLQFLLGVSDPKVADVSKSNGIETDNDSNGSTNLPQTKAQFSNVSLIGPKADANTQIDGNFGQGIHFKKNTGAMVHNSVVAGWPIAINLDGSGVVNNANTGSLFFKNGFISGNTQNFKSTDANFDFNAWFTTHNSFTKTSNADLKLENSFRQTGANYLPGSGSELLSGADFNGLDSFFERVSYRGAFGTTDWTQGWTNFDPQNTDY
ncbi:T9SS C-terminal target domain-containing protein [Adhaeribacter soli]|uniref:T9SS C-terminal target domain-containing protein n=1 Tax=Adhaeribacter soli TaxID=2607655 RepID=A0A5N1ITJ9_9BACT|nr:T9SS C-terminal target domain-containing protein [Adhaeribacter soli]KAA9331239.1 T9SS C-terminal target domain-containing protein [Adhaeribacter soli]